MQTDMALIMRADAWAATAAWVTAGIALVTVLVAGWFADKQVKAVLLQIKEAQRARREQDERAQEALAQQARLAQQTLEHEAREAQKTRDEIAQPNVVAYVEQNPAEFYALELVIKNFGATPAKDVRLSFDPEPQVSPHASGDTGIIDLWYPEVIPTLAPMQEWRTLWDLSHKRFEFPELPSRHEVRVTFEDSKGESHETESVLDWESLRGTEALIINTVHDVAKRLKEQNEKLDVIAKALKAFSSPSSGIRVSQAETDSP
ncbi:hypothetical protein IU438_04745 [Nocardia cyriacigeorgica]|uniref:hypothetical protein n=1 Tax=Nocardia cyriacigeorgica TaxID=135487 RepID=UPI001893E241|nr:hypothetical protein [Nocardia cyriacigeorgica]MBF6161351.1 hypothetical protein [Nocardia cyriacigeorgica]MBF6200224.1 hypothetical protein [Nocardia cyriacigeorgica]MBF6395091.1 hypothetical protein [Nocardia cyriacigeorgica]MBF6400724.1 hypothetical protein [Nocardia cyriacigeorgica]